MFGASLTSSCAVKKKIMTMKAARRQVEPCQHDLEDNDEGYRRNPKSMFRLVNTVSMDSPPYGGFL
jgi:hypothetical protein